MHIPRLTCIPRILLSLNVQFMLPIKAVAIPRPGPCSVSADSPPQQVLDGLPENSATPDPLSQVHSNLGSRLMCVLLTLNSILLVSSASVFPKNDVGIPSRTNKTSRSSQHHTMAPPVHIHTLSPTHFLPRAAEIEPNVSMAAFYYRPLSDCALPSRHPLSTMSTSRGRKFVARIRNLPSVPLLWLIG